MSIPGSHEAFARIGCDIGGTFTDVAAVDAEGRLHIGKRLTTHGNEHQGVIQAIQDTAVDLASPDLIVAHGTTLVINSLLERHGANVALVTTLGFPDVIDVGRGNRSDIFNMRFRRSPPLIADTMRFEVDERMNGDGSLDRAPSNEALAALAERLRQAGAEAVAIGFLNAYANPANEDAVAAFLRAALPDVPVTTSSSISRQWREYERFTTAAANAYIAPVFQRYLGRLTGGLEQDGFSGEFIVLDSSGGAMTVDSARRQPVRAVESGPVGGVIGARSLAHDLGIANLVALDIGGTTAKSTLVENGDYATRDLYWIGGEKQGFPLQVSTVDILEVGVGGGSIARIDERGALQVGPRSAGSKPGPACYGLGGTQPTLTDANLYCGRIDKDHFAGTFSLDIAAAETAIARVAAEGGMSPDRLALGIIRLACLQAASTVRRQTLERGNDPRDYTLLASGGAGPLHACEVAVEVGIDRVLIPRFPGHYSALGMLSANLRQDRREQMVQDIDTLSPQAVRELLDRAASDLTGELGGTGEMRGEALAFRYSVALRFAGQEHVLWIAPPAAGLDVPDDFAACFRRAFETEYLRRYGHLDKLSRVETAEVQVIAERPLPPVSVDFTDAADGTWGENLSLWGEGEGVRIATPIIPRSTLKEGDRFAGPAVLHEVGSTTAIPPGATAEVLRGGAILVDVRHVRGGSAPA
ncbi:hydantoinase/oxoprolinase family protein [Sphingomonadaceae bacterium jetA1]|jgi:N-methylhydantoinase A|uniref:hydantoinase/oxoprolinase family protein n=1 Tax=Facivitalis istanbulensis TaxID=3075838 RepID=UPI00348A8BC9